jgi:hypothetical protein
VKKKIVSLVFPFFIYCAKKEHFYEVYPMGHWRGQLTIKKLVKISLRDYEKIGSKIIKQHLQLEGCE